MISANLRRLENYKFLIEKTGNRSFVASIVSDNKHRDDDLGALYYVVAVIFIYGFSIVLMIASHIRKNKMDQKLTSYLKEMANVRKRERQIQLFNAAARASLAHIMTKQEQAEANERYSRRFNMRLPSERNESQGSDNVENNSDREQKSVLPEVSVDTSVQVINENLPQSRKPSRIRFSSPLAQIDKDSIAHDSITETEQESRETDCLISVENDEERDGDCSDNYCQDNDEDDDEDDDDVNAIEEDDDDDEDIDHPWVINDCDNDSQASSDRDSVFEGDDFDPENPEEGSSQKKDNSQIQLISCL